mgnify:CR=1 FL=1
MKEREIKSFNIKECSTYVMLLINMCNIDWKSKKKKHKLSAYKAICTN